MKICVITKTLLKGGAEKQSLLLAETLSKQYEVIFVVWNGNSGNQYEDETIKNFYPIFNLTGNILKRFVKFYKILKEYQINVIFSYLLTTNLAASILGKAAKVDFIIGGIRNSYHPKIKEYLLKLIHNYICDYTILNCSFSLDALKSKGFNEKKLMVIPNGIKIREFVLPPKNKDEILILSVGRFVKQKDYLTAVKSINYLYYHLLNNTSLRIRYYIVGYGELRNEIENEINKRELNEVIKIINDSSLNEIFLDADIYLCTSLYEGVSNSILEAMNHSLPIVASKAGDNPKLVANAENGFLCDLMDWRGFANSLNVLVRYPEYRTEMGKKSFKILEENYSLKLFEERYLEFLNKLDKNLSQNDISYSYNLTKINHK
jgi:glycosyltransferase involved in cell wall biosynthesis